jgi:hypothetical protein
MKDIRQSEQYQDQTQLNRQKEDNKMMTQNSKNEIEREKLQVQRDIADKQLQIAQTNKNKFDKGSSSKKS